MDPLLAFITATLGIVALVVRFGDRFGRARKELLEEADLLSRLPPGLEGRDELEVVVSRGVQQYARLATRHRTWPVAGKMFETQIFLTAFLSTTVVIVAGVVAIVQDNSVFKLSHDSSLVLWVATPVAIVAWVLMVVGYVADRRGVTAEDMVELLKKLDERRPGSKPD